MALLLEQRRNTLDIVQLFWFSKDAKREGRLFFFFFFVCFVLSLKAHFLLHRGRLYHAYHYSLLLYINTTVKGSVLIFRGFSYNNRRSNTELFFCVSQPYTASIKKKKCLRITAFVSLFFLLFL